MFTYYHYYQTLGPIYILYSTIANNTIYSIWGWQHNHVSWSYLTRKCEKQFKLSVPQIEYPLGVSSKNGSHIYFLLIVAMILLLWRQIVLLWHQVTRVASEEHLFQTIVLPRKLATGSIHDYLFCYCPLVDIPFEVLRITSRLCVNISQTVDAIWTHFW